MMMIWSQPAASASSTPYWMMGLSTMGSISLGCALVAGRNRVPKPAAGKTALRTFCAIGRSVLEPDEEAGGQEYGCGSSSDPNNRCELLLWHRDLTLYERPGQSGAPLIEELGQLQSRTFIAKQRL